MDTYLVSHPWLSLDITDFRYNGLFRSPKVHYNEVLLEYEQIIIKLQHIIIKQNL